jgi:hypothetical protein
MARRTNPGKAPATDEEQSLPDIPHQQRNLASTERLYRFYNRNATREGRAMEEETASQARLSPEHSIYTVRTDFPPIQESYIRAEPLPGRFQSPPPVQMASNTLSRESTSHTPVLQSPSEQEFSPRSIASVFLSILTGLGRVIPYGQRGNDTQVGAVATDEARQQRSLSPSPTPPMYSPITPPRATPQRATPQIDSSPGSSSFHGDPESPLHGRSRRQLRSNNTRANASPPTQSTELPQQQLESPPRGRPRKVADSVRPIWDPEAGIQVLSPIDMAVTGFDYSSLPPFTNTDTNKRPANPWTVNGRRYVCPTCGCAIAKKDNMEHHIRRHAGSNPWRCRFCDHRFRRDYDAYPHVERMHKGEAHQSGIQTLAKKRQRNEDEDDEEEESSATKRKKRASNESTLRRSVSYDSI